MNRLRGGHSSSTEAGEVEIGTTDRSKANPTLSESAVARAWRDVWSFLQDSRVGFGIGEIVLAVVGAVVGPAVWGNGLFARAVSALIAVLAGCVILFFIVFGVVLVRAPYRQRNEARSVIATTRDEFAPGVPGWDSKVTGIAWENRSGSPPRTLYFRLYPPAEYSSDSEISARLSSATQEWEGKPKWYQAGTDDRAHYGLFHYPGFVSKESDQGLSDGKYRLSWTERYGVGWRNLTEPHFFAIRDGYLVDAVPE